MIPHLCDSKTSRCLRQAISGESTSVKRGAVAGAEGEELARLRLRSEGKRGQTRDMEDTLEPKAEAKATLDPKRFHTR